MLFVTGVISEAEETGGWSKVELHVGGRTRTISDLWHQSCAWSLTGGKGGDPEGSRRWPSSSLCSGGSRDRLVCRGPSGTPACRRHCHVSGRLSASRMDKFRRLKL